MYSITVESVTDEGFEFVRKYKAHEKAKAMDDWYHTVENLLPGREKGTLRGPNGIMSEYTPMGFAKKGVSL